MKKIILAITLCLISSAANAETVVAYVHNSIRCRTCMNMENWTVEASKELPVTFVAINTDIKENKHYLTDYKLYTKSVIIKDTKTNKYKNLDKVWNYARNKQNFINYIKTEANKFIEEQK